MTDDDKTTWTPPPAAIPDLWAFLGAADEQGDASTSPVHGLEHWKSVARHALALLRAGEPANPAVVFAFAALHDHARRHDGADVEHGPRAAANLPKYLGSTLLLAEHEAATLHDALSCHTTARIVTEPTIAVCLDADRLDLPRVDKTPRRDLLSTTSAKRPLRVVRETTWTAILDAYQTIADPASRFRVATAD